MKIVTPRIPRMTPSPRGIPLSCSPIVENSPISPQETLETYSSLLMPYEIDEIQRYKSIYFLGYPNAKNKTMNDSSVLCKFNPKDHIAYRYEIIKSLGSGTFGKVFSAFDYKMKKHVAIKIFSNNDDIQNQSDTEATILAQLNKFKCQNTVKGIDYFCYRTHPCITFELLGSNLYVMQIKDCFRPYKLSIVRDYAIQIFRGLYECSKLNIIHCDLKPENICTTIEDPKKVKIIDFGCACYTSSSRPNKFYIQSRYYRSPEVILRLKYGPKIDVWSAALIIIELLTGRHVFPGKNELDMLNLMVDMLGPIPRSMVNASRKKRTPFFSKDGSLKPSSSFASKKKMMSIQYLFGNDPPPHLIDFLQKCLMWKPNLRMSALEALQHPWMQQKTVNKTSEVEGLPCLMKNL